MNRADPRTLREIRAEMIPDWPRTRVRSCAKPEMYADPIAHGLIFAAHDLEARFFLLDLGEREYNAGNMRGSARLWHAEMYLKDRLAYQLFPPPTKYSIPAWRFDQEDCI
jgi:hypothetical protein